MRGGSEVQKKKGQWAPRRTRDRSGKGTEIPSMSEMDTALDAINATLSQRGISVWAEGDQVRFHSQHGPIDPDLQSLLRKHRSSIIEKLAVLDGQGIGAPLLRKAAVSGRHRLLFLQDMSAELYVPGAHHKFHLIGRRRLSGRFDRNRFRRCVEDLVRRHSILRAIIEPGELWRRHLSIADAVEIDVEELRPEEGDAALEFFEHRPFNLAFGPLLRVGVLPEADDRHIVTLVFQHAIADGLSVSLAWREILHRYHALELAPNSAPLSDLPLQFSDVMRFRHEWLGSAAALQRRKYWRKKLLHCSDPFSLPYDSWSSRDRIPTLSAPKGSLSSVDCMRLSSAAKAHRLTLSNLCLGAFAITLSRWSGRFDIVSWVAHSGRRRKEYFHLVGCFADHWLLRVSIDPAWPTLEGLKAVSAAANEAQGALELPGVNIAAEFTDIPGESLDNIIMFNFMPSGKKADLSTSKEETLNSDSLASEPVELSPDPAYTEEGSRIALMITVHASEVSVNWTLRYDPNCFTSPTGEALCGAFGNVLQQIADLSAVAA